MFRAFSDPIQLISFLLMIPAALIAISVHESAHGWVSYRLGDPTAHNLGRITLNPIKHFDPIGFLMLVLFHFGWAKPVPVNARYYKKPRRDMALVAAAGPASNLLLGFFGILVLYLVFLAGSSTAETFSMLTKGQLYVGTSLVETLPQKLLYLIFVFLYQFAALNVGLAIFNLIPLPPFDGSRMAYIFLPAKWYFGIMRYERYIMIGFLILIWLGAFSGVISTIAGGVISGMGWLIERLPFFRFA